MRRASTTFYHRLVSLGLVLTLLFFGGGQSACMGSDGRVAIEPPGAHCEIDGCAIRSAPEQSRIVEHGDNCADFLLAGIMVYRQMRPSQMMDAHWGPALHMVMQLPSSTMTVSVCRIRSPVDRFGGLSNRLIRSTILLI